ncbi:hypothetical protein GCM10009654_31660 [Streptomyces hebeiensis]|uniref:Uncharacterized protein n=1 Tax=Streptomyces hebeiensis TaxID=229486 RepID=A0ABP4FEN2_9ACTN
MPAWNAPKAALTATVGPKSTKALPTTTATPTAPRRATNGSSCPRSIVNPERAVSFNARSQLMDRG